MILPIPTLMNSSFLALILTPAPLLGCAGAPAAAPAAAAPPSSSLAPAPAAPSSAAAAPWSRGVAAASPCGGRGRSASLVDVQVSAGMCGWVGGCAHVYSYGAETESVLGS